MANTKINLIGQSDQNLSGATIMSPVGIEMKDLSGLVENLDALSITDGEIQDKLDAAISDEAKYRKAADEQIAQDLSDYGTSNNAALAAEAKERIFTDAGLQTAIDLEKGRLDVILSGSQVDLNQFKEVVEFIETIDLQNDEDLLGAVTSINVDITANKVAAEDADAAEKAARIDADAAEKLRAETSEGVLQGNISDEASTARSAEAQIAQDLSDYGTSNDAALAAEEAARIAAVAAEKLRAETSEAQIAQDLSDYGTSNDAALAAEEAARITADAGLQTAIDLEKGRLDVILSGSQVDLNQFKEVVEFIETIDLKNDAELLGAVTSINVDITANKVAAEDAVAAEVAVRKAVVAAEEARAKTAEEDLKDNISAVQTELDEYKSSNDDALEDEVKRSTGVETALSAKTDEMIAQFTDGLRKEQEERKAGDDALDTKINDVVFNETPGMNSIYELGKGIDKVMEENIYNFIPRRSEIGDYDSETGVVTLSKGYFKQTFMFFINGLMMDDGDYTSLDGNDESEGVIGLELLGDAKTLADNGAKMVEYGIQAGDFTFLMEEPIDEGVELSEERKRKEEGDATKLPSDIVGPIAEGVEGEGGE
jgi:adenylate cyclase class IV